jgi:hypothetical protein
MEKKINKTRGGKREGAKRPTLYDFKTKTISIRVTGQDFKKFASNEKYEVFFARLKTAMNEKYQELLQGIA